MKSDPAAGTVPVASEMSMYDPVYLGIDQYRAPVYTRLPYKNILVAGEPGAGKSTALNDICAHAAMTSDARLMLLDGKYVELSQWEDVADLFVGPNAEQAIIALLRLQTLIDNRYAWLTSQRRRKLTRRDRLSVVVCVVDEIAYYTTIAGTKQQQELFGVLLRDIVSRGRACGVVVVAATQRPSGADNPPIIPASLRDIFGYRLAFRCTTDDSSDLVLGRGMASAGYTAASIAPDDAGVGLLLAEGGLPRKIRVPFLTDDQIDSVADYAAWTRRTHTTPDPTRMAEVVPIKEVA